jgi:hypothetical protein
VLLIGFNKTQKHISIFCRGETSFFMLKTNPSLEILHYKLRYPNVADAKMA